MGIKYFPQFKLGFRKKIVQACKRTQHMKIFICTDLEGVSGVFKFAQTHKTQNPLFREAMEYLMGDIAAVVKGLRESGGRQITVLDGHNGGNNFIPHLMEPGAEYLVGAPASKDWGLDRTCDGLIMLGFHAMAGTEDGVLYHTQSSASERHYWYNEVESGELVQVALFAGHFGVPPIMVTGDTTVCREARRFFGPHCITVAVKKGIARESACLYPFAQTRQALYEGAKKALKAVSLCKPYKLRMPIKARMRFFQKEECPSRTRVVEKTGRITDLSDYENIVAF